MKNDISVTIEEKIKNLKKEKDKILALPADKAFEEIISSNNAAALVHSLKEEDLYILINEIGYEDSFELISMASAKQLDYIFDIEIWDKDRLDIKEAVKWLGYIFKADGNRLMTWIFKEDTEEKIPFLEFILNKTVDIIIREHDQDTSDFEDGFFTFDDTFYIKPKQVSELYKYNHGDPEIPEEDNVAYIDDKDFSYDFFYDFLKKIAAFDIDIFFKILTNQNFIIPSEYEEEALRFRNVRLAEKGFAPYEIAAAVYRGLAYDDFKKTKKKLRHKNSDIENLPIPVFYTDYSDTKNRFTNALRNMNDLEINEIQAEFASLCNHIISADQVVIRGRSDLKKILLKVGGYIVIGLQRLEYESKKKFSLEDDKNILREYFLENIFKLGSAAIFKIKWKAEKFIKTSWFIEKGFDLTFWDEELAGVLGGVLLNKPLFFDNYKNGTLYRDFADFEDIETTDKLLDKIILFDELFKTLFLTPYTLIKQIDTFIYYKNFLLTSWADSFIKKNSEKTAPLTSEEIKFFLKNLFTENEPKKIKNSMKEEFLSWCAIRSKQPSYAISRKYGAILEDLFYELEEEYKNIGYDAFDPKYSLMFLRELDNTKN